MTSKKERRFSAESGKINPNHKATLYSLHNPGTVVAAFPATTDAVKGAAATTGSRPGSRQSVPVVVRRNDDVPVPGALLGDRDGPVLEGVVRPPEQVLPVVLEALVERGHREDEQHRPEQTGQAVDFPLLEQDRLVVTAVELCRRRGEGENR